MSKVTPPQPGDPDYTMPPALVRDSEHLLALYDDVVRRTEDFARQVAERARSHPDTVSDLIRRMADATTVVFQRWTLPILYALSIDPGHDLRYSQIRATVHGISSRSLSLTLRDMERNGLVARHVSEDKPPHVSYSLTPRGLTLSRLSCPLLLHLNPILEDQLRSPKASR